MPPVAQSSELERALEALAAGRHRDPFAVLGPHPDDGALTTIRTMQPAARAVDVHLLETGAYHPMRRHGASGVFEAALPGTRPDYRLRVTFNTGQVIELDDPYRYGRVLSDFDLHLIGEGTQYRMHEKLGAHRIRLGSTTGVHFAVW